MDQARESKLVPISPPSVAPEASQGQAAIGLRAVCEPAELGDSITAVCEKLRRARNRPLLTLICEFIDDDFVQEFCKLRIKLSELAKADKPAGGIDILLSSPGGDLDSCFTLARLLGRWLTSWEALVPYYATSGATLICLGSANLVMSEQARLGPLDPQERFFGMERSSAFQAFWALRRLRDFALESVESGVDFLVERKVPPELALKIASELSVQFVGPIVAKIDPADIGVFSMNGAMAIDYCTRIGSPSDPAKRTQRKVDPAELIRCPGHEFAIDLEAARRLNFVVSEAAAELEELFDQLRPLLGKVDRYVGLIP